MTSSNTLWACFNSDALVTAEEVLAETRATGKPIRQGVAWMHNTLYSAVIKKAGSVDNLIAIVTRIAGPNEEAAAVLRNQLKQCVILRDMFADACRAVMKSNTPQALAASLMPKLGPWVNSDVEPKKTLVLLSVLTKLLAVAYGEPGNIFEAVGYDETLPRTVKSNLLCVLSTHEQMKAPPRIDQIDAEFELSDKAWPAFAESLSSGQRGVFLQHLQLAIIALSNWREELDDRPSATPLLSARLEDMDETWGADLWQFVKAGKADAQASKYSNDAATLVREHLETNREDPNDFIYNLGATFANAWKNLPPEDASTLNNALKLLGNCCAALSLSRTQAEVAALCAKDIPGSGTAAVFAIYCLQAMNRILFWDKDGLQPFF